MRATTKTLLSLLAITCGGCGHSGLSPHEFNQNLATAMYRPSDPASTQPGGAPLTVSSPQAIAVPIAVGVVQMGEVAPPQAMLDAFRHQPRLFNLVEPLPGNLSDPSGAGNAKPIGSDEMQHLRSAAAGMGLSYLMVYGGTVDTGRAPTPLTVFDLTIVGAFVIPSEQIWANGKATGSLIEVSTGRVILNLSVDANDSAFWPTVMADNNDALTNSVREQLIEKITTQTIDRLGEHRSQPVSADDSHR